MKYIHKYHVGMWVIPVVIALIITKFIMHRLGFDIVVVTPLFTSTMASAIFIISILLAGILTDYKEAEKFPSDLRAALENILDDCTQFSKTNISFDIKKLKLAISNIIETFLKGIGHEGDHYNLSPCLKAVNALSNSFSEMEIYNAPANYIVRLRQEQSSIRKIVLRTFQIQKTTFIPSVQILAQSLIMFLTLFLLFLKTEGSIESYILFAFITYFFLYIGRLITVLEKPFREDHGTLDDVSLFLLRDFNKSNSDTIDKVNNYKKS